MKAVSLPTRNLVYKTHSLIADSLLQNRWMETRNGCWLISA